MRRASRRAPSSSTSPLCPRLRFNLSLSSLVSSLSLRTSVPEPLRLLASFPLRDGPEWLHGEEHPEELPGHAPVHGQVPSDGSPGRSGQPQNRVTDASLFFLFQCVCVCVGRHTSWCARLCFFHPANLTAPPRPGMNGLLHWEQRGLFLAPVAAAGATA